MSSGAEVGGVAMVKYFGLPVIIGALAAGLGFVVLWPRTVQEGVARIVSSIVLSALLGPALAIAALHYLPGVFEGAAAMAVMLNAPVDYVYMTLTAPCFAIAGLPAWWLVGALIRWLEKRRSQDIGQLLKDASKTLREVQS